MKLSTSFVAPFSACLKLPKTLLTTFLFSLAEMTFKMMFLRRFVSNGEEREKVFNNFRNLKYKI